MPYNKMQAIYNNIVKASSTGEKLLAVLIDPDNINIDHIPSFLEKLHQSITTHIFIGGSTDENNKTHEVVEKIKQFTRLPVIVFPGDHKQITSAADAILFLSLISGRNPEYLIEQQIKAVPLLKDSNLEIIPTGYILIDGGIETAVQKVSNTLPIAQSNNQLIIDTALAGQYSGKKLIYLEAGSGAIKSINPEIIKVVKKELKIPLIVGGGIRSKKQLEQANKAGADMVVIGTAFENDLNFFNELKHENIG